MTRSATVGVLALQGAFVEHEAALRRLWLPDVELNTVQVRTPEDLAQCDAMVIPGGESTTMALLARTSGLLDPLRAFVETKPVWGTCAGAILLASGGVVRGSAKRGGQELLGGVDITIERNGWGTQVESFEAPLEFASEGGKFLGSPTRGEFRGIFIRAPVIDRLLPPSADRPPIFPLARLPESLLPRTPGGPEYIHTDSGRDPEAESVVALRQGRTMLTTFHPELTDDTRFHEYFVREIALGSL